MFTILSAYGRTDIELTKESHGKRRRCCKCDPWQSKPPTSRVSSGREKNPVTIVRIATRGISPTSVEMWRLVPLVASSGGFSLARLSRALFRLVRPEHAGLWLVIPSRNQFRFSLRRKPRAAQISWMRIPSVGRVKIPP